MVSRRTDAPRLVRARQPQPWLTHRVRSGRGATEQPNATGDAGVEVTLRFWLLVVATGVATGLLGAGLMSTLHAVEQLAYGHRHAGFAAAVASTSGSRRVLVLTLGGAVSGLGWYVIRRVWTDDCADIDDALWSGHSRLSLRRSAVASVLSEVAVGVGASLGREAAPKLMGGASGSVLAGWGRLTPGQRRLLVACGGGAGMAAVYNVPLGGALITAEVLYGALTLSVVLPALACSTVATAVAWVYLPNQPTYLHVRSGHVTAALLTWSVLAGLLIGVLSVGYVRLIGHVNDLRPTGWRVAVGPAIVFAALGLLGLHYPQLLGNGTDLAAPAFLGVGTVGLLLTLAVLKPIATLGCLGSGATGGLFTPTMATGAVLGGGLGLAWTHLWAGTPLAAYAVVGATAMLGAGLQAPLAALVVVLELTGTTGSLLVPMLVATTLSTTVARALDGYSIYSVRLPPSPVAPTESS